MISVVTQNAPVATLVDDVQDMLHAWEGAAPPLGIVLHGEAPAAGKPSKGAATSLILAQG